MTTRIIQGDCRDALAALPDASVHCCVTSPPYFGLRDYGHAAQIGLEATPDAYVAELVAVFREVRRVLRDDGTLWLNLGDSYASKPCTSNGYQDGRANRDERTSAGVPAGLKPKDLLGIPWRVAFALQADGWWLRQDIIWSKPNPMPESVTDRCTKAHEYVFLLSKSARYFFDAAAIAEPIAESTANDGRLTREGYDVGRPERNFPGSPSRGSGLLVPKNDPTKRNRRSVWTIATQGFADAHFATMAPELAENCIKAGTSEKGVCPYCAAPWLRVTESLNGAPHDGTSATKYDPTSTAGRLSQLRQAARERGGEYSASRITVAWKQGCACAAADPVPATVLDPFAGAGTTGLVADCLQRSAILIEINPVYADLARDRIVGDAPLFAEVV